MDMRYFYNKEKWSFSIHDELPDDKHKEASIALGIGLVKDDFSIFEKMLDKNVVWMWPSSTQRTLVGRDAVLKYWKDFGHRMSDDVLGGNFSVMYCANKFMATLSMQPNDKSATYILFYIERGKVKIGLSVARVVANVENSANNFARKHHETLDDFPFTVDFVMKHHISSLLPKSNRIPCLSCGKTSELLKWENIAFSNGGLEYHAEISVCPNCNKVIEYLPVKVYQKQSVEESCTEEGLKDGTQQADSKIGVAFYYSTPLKGSKYIEALPKTKNERLTVATGILGEKKEIVVSLYDIAAYFDERILMALRHSDGRKYAMIEDCYIAAWEDGVSEAGNNLGILAYNLERNVCVDGIDYFVKASECGSSLALYNLVMLYWADGKYKLAYQTLRKYTERKGYNRLGFEGKFFHELLKIGVLNHAFVDLTMPLQACLPKIKLKEEWYISMKVVSYDVSCMGGDSYFYFAHREDSSLCFDRTTGNIRVEGEIYRDCLKRVVLENNLSAVWEVYLLMTANTVLPYYGYSVRNHRTFIFGELDLHKIRAFENRDIEPLKKNGILFPKVQIKKCRRRYEAHVYCCYWNDWKGLVREHVIMKIQNNQIVAWQEDDFIIYSYRCGREC